MRRTVMNQPSSRVRPSRSIRSAIAVIASGALAVAGLSVGAAAAAAAPMKPGDSTAAQSFESGRYIVTVVGDSRARWENAPGADRRRGISPDDYAAQLAQRQEQVAASVGAQIDASYTVAVNAFVAELTGEQAAQLAADRDVVAVSPDVMLHTTAESGPEFLGLEGSGGVWESIGGPEAAGEGIVVGVLDTGIAPENPAFAGEVLGTAPGTEPYLDGSTITFQKADGDTFTGVCTEGEQFEASDCSTKIIGARYYLDGFGEENLGDASTGPGEFVSPRDGDGHGSHTASTAAGNYANPASIGDIDFGNISGVAPAAKIAIYKVCWSGPDPTVQTDDGCTTSDTLQAVDDAIDDGVDVINYSVGGGAATTTYSVTDDAFLGAAAAGIFVAVSAGNDGPGASTADHASPWLTTVAASTIPSYEATVTLGNGGAYAGASITVPFDGTPVTGPLVYAADIALPGATDPALCAPDSLDPALITPETIVVCDRGVYDRVAKSAEVARIGGQAMILVNPTPNTIDTDLHSVPTVHLNAEYREPVVSYAQADGATATLSFGNDLGTSPPSPQVAGFSSRGPILADGSQLLKPDISAPGVSILAAGPNQGATEPTYAFKSGTSMASPHIAGLAALYLGVNPLAAPAEIKSAMMTTAYDTVDAEGDPITDPFAQGAGHVDPTRFFDPGLLYLNDVLDWLGYIAWLGYDTEVDPISGSNLNLASIQVSDLTAPVSVTRTVTATEAGDWTASVQGVDGVEVTVEPSTLHFEAAGEQASFTVTFARTTATLDQYAVGSLTWTGATTVRSPIAVQPVTIVAPYEADGTGVTGSVEVEVTPGGDGEIPLTSTRLSLGSLLPDPTGVEDEHSGSGDNSSPDFEYSASVAEGAVFARFDLDALDDELETPVDLDLYVYLLDAEGTPIALYQSATGAADERVDIEAPTAGNYLVIVDVFDAPEGIVFDLTTTSVVPGGAPLTFDPAVLQGQQGVPVAYQASWTGLQPFSTYLGLAYYAETGVYTVVQVATGEGPIPGAPVNLTLPTISGKAEVGKKLTASPGTWDMDGLTFAYQWQADGVDIPGATDKKYKLTAGDQGKTITVVVTATKGDLPPGSATSEGVVVKFKSTTSVSLSRSVLFSWQTTTATVKVDSADDQPPTGEVTISVNGESTAVPLVDGVATYQLPEFGSGVYLVKASYGGDELNRSSSSARPFWVIF
jgi:subtilisin family serine protease